MESDIPMNIMVAGHITIDTIIHDFGSKTTLGGPPCYAGLQARNLGADVSIITRVGYDFPESYAIWLSRNQLRLNGQFLSRAKPTTRFCHLQKGGRRGIRLLSICENIEVDGLADSDAIIISPVAGEISESFVEKAAKRVGVVLLDPQGFVRSFDRRGFYFLSKHDSSFLEKVSILKGDIDELRCLTSELSPVDVVQKLRDRGPSIVIATHGSANIILSSSKGAFLIPVDEVKNTDGTGAGDIFSASFLTSFLKGKDEIWASCFAAASHPTGMGIGLEKVGSTRELNSLLEEKYKRVVRLR